MRRVLGLLLATAVSATLARVPCERDCELLCAGVEEPPFLVIDRNKSSEDFTRYSGIMVEILSELVPSLSRNLTWSIYEIPSVTVGGTGARGTLTSEFSGIVAELVSGRADVGVNPMVVLPSRYEVVSFTTPLADTSHRVIALKGESSEASFAFLRPITPELWVVILATAVAVGSLARVLDVLSPQGVTATGGAYGLLGFELGETGRAMGMALCALSNAGGTAGKSWATRLILTSWYFFCMTVIAGYTANLTVFLANDVFSLHSVESLEELALPGHSFGVLNGSSSALYFLEMEGMAAKSYLLNMREYFSEAEALNDLRNGDIKGYIQEELGAKYIAGQDPCAFEIVGRSFGHGHSALAVRKQSSGLAYDVSLELLKMRRDGIVDKIQDLSLQGFDETCDDEDGTTINGVTRLGILHFSGLLLFLGICAIISLVLVVLERLMFHKAYRKFGRMTYELFGRVSWSIRRRRQLRREERMSLVSAQPPSFVGTPSPSPTPTAVTPQRPGPPIVSLT